MRLLPRCRNVALPTLDADERAVASQHRRVTCLETGKFVVRAIDYCWQYMGQVRAL